MIFTAFLVFSLLFSVVLLLIVSSAFLGFLRTRVPFVPTSRGDVEFFVKNLSIGSEKVFYDLGSGNGKVCFLVNRLTGASCVGYELTWWTYVLAKIKLKFILLCLSYGGQENKNGKNNRIKFYRKNFFKADWTQADFVYGYLYPPLMGRVEEKFLAECKPGSIAIIRDFPFPNIKHSERYFLPKRHELYIYKIAEK